jgi:hypothetical protein
MRGFGVENVDFRLRQSDFALDGPSCRRWACRSPNCRRCQARAGRRFLPAQGPPAGRDPPARRRQGGRQAVDRPRFGRRQPDPDRQPPDRRAERLAGRAVGNRGRRRRRQGRRAAGRLRERRTGRRRCPAIAATLVSRMLPTAGRCPAGQRRRAPPASIEAARPRAVDRRADRRQVRLLRRSGQHRRRLPGQCDHAERRSCSPSRRKPTCC